MIGSSDIGVELPGLGRSRKIRRWIGCSGKFRKLELRHFRDEIRFEILRDFVDELIRHLTQNDQQQSTLHSNDHLSQVRSKNP